MVIGALGSILAAAVTGLFVFAYRNLKTYRARTRKSLSALLVVVAAIALVSGGLDGLSREARSILGGAFWGAGALAVYAYALPWIVVFFHPGRKTASRRVGARPVVIESNSGKAVRRTLTLEIPGLEVMDVDLYLTGKLCEWGSDPALRYQETETPGSFSLTAEIRAGENFKHYVLSKFAERAEMEGCLRRAGYRVTGSGDESLEHPEKWRTWFLLRLEDGFPVVGEGVYAANVW